MALGVALQYCNYMLAPIVSVPLVLQVLSRRLLELAKFNEHTNVLCSEEYYFSVIFKTCKFTQPYSYFLCCLFHFFNVQQKCKTNCLCLQDDLLCILFYSYILLIRSVCLFNHYIAIACMNALSIHRYDYTITTDYLSH